ncbi:MAG: hypothetical protein JRG82_06370, partial [Deltaproteobacteria bacterium]|nr:hypothetical protein [Deltaproteobacteria bacterium]
MPRLPALRLLLPFAAGIALEDRLACEPHGALAVSAGAALGALLFAWLGRPAARPFARPGGARAC